QPADDAWRYRPSAAHARYWTGHCLPIILILVDPNTEATYWQLVSENTVGIGPRGGLIIDVPRTQTLDTAKTDLQLITDKRATLAGEMFAENMDVLPQSTRKVLARLRD